MKTRNALFEWNEARVARKRNNEPRKGVNEMNIENIEESIKGVVRDYPGLLFARKLFFDLRQLIPLKENSKEWLDEVKQSKLLTGNELRELRTFVYALTESRFEFDANVSAIEALNINNWTPSHQDWVL